jgi:hypothetical protein
MSYSSLVSCVNPVIASVCSPFVAAGNALYSVVASVCSAVSGIFSSISNPFSKGAADENQSLKDLEVVTLRTQIKELKEAKDVVESRNQELLKQIKELTGEVAAGKKSLGERQQEFQAFKENSETEKRGLIARIDVLGQNPQGLNDEQLAAVRGEKATVEAQLVGTKSEFSDADEKATPLNSSNRSSLAGDSSGKSGVVEGELDEIKRIDDENALFEENEKLDELLNITLRRLEERSKNYREELEIIRHRFPESYAKDSSESSLNS